MPNPVVLPQKSHTTQLSDIAVATGYSLATVSKVLNGRKDVSDRAREIINKALSDSGYQRRIKSTKDRKLVEIVFQSFDSLWCLEVMRGSLREAQSHGLHILTTESGTSNHPDAIWLDDVLRRQPLGVILVFSDLSELEKEKLHTYHINYVTLDPSGTPSSNSISVQADNWTGGVIATRHLLSLGHTRIGIITGPDNMMCSKARLNGYQAALAEKSITYDPSLVREGNFKTDGGYLKALELLRDSNQRPTAIFGGCDLQCMGIYEAARELGIRIPEDLSVVGFDDIQISKNMGPSLTTVRQPLQDMAATAIKMLLNSAAGKPTENSLFPTTLVVRNSTAKLES